MAAAKDLPSAPVTIIPFPRVIFYCCLPAGTYFIEKNLQVDLEFNIEEAHPISYRMGCHYHLGFLKIRGFLRQTYSAS
jgi:hypothetical protein